MSNLVAHGASSGGGGNPSSCVVLTGANVKAIDIEGVLHQRIAFVSGGRDRGGRPVITFPARVDAEKTSIEELRIVLDYLHAITSDDVKEAGFTVLIDMRHGITWHAIKPILKVLQDFFPGHVNLVYIIKPDKFWEKQKASIGTTKYKFEVCMTQIEHLSKYIDSTQLTHEFDGSIHYDNVDWIDVRKAIEDLLWKIMDNLGTMEKFRKALANPDDPKNADGARRAIDELNTLKRNIGKCPVEELEVKGQQLIQRLTGIYDDANTNGGNDSDYGSACRDSQINPDFAAVAPRIGSLIENLRSTRQELYAQLQVQKLHADQCFQLKLFEQDAEKMCDWIRQNVELFLSNYTEIGETSERAKELMNVHSQSMRGAMNVHVNMNHIITAADRLIANGHYSQVEIRSLADRLQSDWKLFTRALDTRNALLNCSMQFHLKAEQYLRQCGVEWERECRGNDTEIPTTVPELDVSINQHKDLMDEITRAYTEIHGISKTLLYEMDCLVQLCHFPDGMHHQMIGAANALPAATPAYHHRQLPPVSGTNNTGGGVSAVLHTQYYDQHSSAMSACGSSSTLTDGRNEDCAKEAESLISMLKSPLPLLSSGRGQRPNTSPPPTPDYQDGAKHVLDVIHQLLAKHRDLEQVWQIRRLRLQHRLALLLYQQDVRQVLDWLDNHGEMYLKKNVAIGKYLNKARNLQKSHLHFESVAQNTYRNAEKLLKAAEDLAGSGECRPEDIYASAQQLRSRITTFATQVRARHQLFDTAVLFHTHHKELMSWFGELEKEQSLVRLTGGDFADCEHKLDEWMTKTNATIEATDIAVREGQQLVSMLRQQRLVETTEVAETVGYVEMMIREIGARQEVLKDTWRHQQLQLELGLQFRLFCQDCWMVLNQIRGWCDDMQGMRQNLNPAQSDQFLPVHQENTAHIQTTIAEIIKNAQELDQVLERSEANLVCVTASINAKNVQEQRQVAVREEIFSLADQVRSQGEESCEMAEKTHKFLKDAMEFQRFRNDAQQVIVWIEREEKVLLAHYVLPSSLKETEQLMSDHERFQTSIQQTQETMGEVQEQASQMLGSDQSYAAQIHEIAETLMAKWRQLCANTEDRHKLLTAAVTYYKTVEQVLPVLDRLYEDYQRPDDVCRDLYRKRIVEQQQQAGGSNAVSPRHQLNRDKISFVSENIDRHLSHKEKFLTGCSHTRRNAELFLKYVRRSVQNMTNVANQLIPQHATAPSQSVDWNTQVVIIRERAQQRDSEIKKVLHQLRERESRTLQLWTQRKKQLDLCQHYVLFEASAKQILEWIHSEAEVYLSTHSSKYGRSKDENEQLLQEHNEFKLNSKAKEQREKVRVLCQIEESMNLATDVHAADIRQWVNTVQERYLDFSHRMTVYQEKLQLTLGKQDVSSRDLALDRRSDSSLDAKTLPGGVPGPVNSRKSLSKKEYIMQEILSSERAYVIKLEECIRVYCDGTKKMKNKPADLVGKEDVVFSNIRNIFAFHKETFLFELEKYELIPENIGHCFNAWADRLQSLYVPYCKNKHSREHQNAIRQHNDFFEAVKEGHKLDESVDSHLIKPIQRPIKYKQLLGDLIKFLNEDTNSDVNKDVMLELTEAYEFIESIPKRSNDILHLSSLEGIQNMNTFGDFITQQCFQVWSPKDRKPIKMMKKQQSMRVFLFENCVVFCKIVLHNEASIEKYHFKFMLTISEISITEHLEGDNCKFALWTGKLPPPDDMKYILKAEDRQSKENWVKRLRKLIGERLFHCNIPYLPLPKADSEKKDNADTRSIDDSSLVSENNRGDRTSYISTTSSEQDVGSSPYKSHSAADVRVVLEDNNVGSEDCYSSGILELPSGSGTGGDNLTDSKSGSESGRRATLGTSDNLGVTTATTHSLSHKASFAGAPELTVRKGQKVTMLPQQQLPGGVAPLGFSYVRLVESPFSEGFVPSKKLSALFASYPSNNKDPSNAQNCQNEQMSAEGTVAPGKKKPKRWFVGTKEKLGSSSTDLHKQSTTLTRIKFGDSINNCEPNSATALSLRCSPNALEKKDQTRPNVSSSVSTASLLHFSTPNSNLDASNEALNAQECADIDIPPPMESLATEKIIGSSNGTCSANGPDTVDTLTDRLAQSSVDPEPASPVKEISAEEQNKQKRFYVLSELVETEKEYVLDLERVAEGYMGSIAQMELPEDMQGKDRIVFANIKQIAEFHKMCFYPEIMNCAGDEENAYESAARVFVKNERKLHMYVKYCENKPKSEFLVSEYETFFADLRKQLGHRLNIADLLIKPVQRIMKYSLLLKDIYKYTKRAGQSTELLEKAMKVMEIIPKHCNDMMNVGRLQGFNGSIHAQGKLVLQGSLQVSDTGATASQAAVFKGKERKLFLFEQSLIVAECIAPKTEFQLESYIYKAHVMVNKLSLDANPVPGEPLRFLLKRKDNTLPKEIVCQASNEEDKDHWCSEISSLLDSQENFLKALQNPTIGTGKNNLAVTGKGGMNRADSCPVPPPKVNAKMSKKEAAKNAAATGGSADDPRKSSVPEKALCSTSEKGAPSPRTKPKLFERFGGLKKATNAKSPT